MNQEFLAAVSAALLAAGGSAQAQSSATAPPATGRGGMARNYDPGKVVTLFGEVADVRMTGGRRNQGVHVDLETSDGVIDVHLGPSWYLDRQGLELTKGDSVEVTGSRVQLGDQSALIAQKVKKGGVTIALRHENGIPKWSRRNR